LRWLARKGRGRVFPDRVGGPGPLKGPKGRRGKKLFIPARMEGSKKQVEEGRKNCPYLP